jgi:beta-aspartyl-dipeptidase (metallo-type)
MILIRNGEVFAPHALGRCDVLVGGRKILALESRIDPGVLPGEVEVIEAGGLAVVPGFVDGHQHFTGGGGEGGFHTRTPEMQLSMNTANGVTTAVGVLGTVALTRSV